MENKVHRSSARSCKRCAASSSVPRGNRRLLTSLLGAAVLGIASLPGCTPLPGASLDPVYLKLGDRPPLVSPTAPAPSKPAPSLPPQSPQATGPTVWVGRYRDSRGEGEITFSFVQSGAALSGTWKLRTGGGGSLKGAVEADRRRLAFQLDNGSPDCAGTFEGWAEVREEAMIGAYHGSDCEGAVSDGRIDLRRR